MDYLAQTLFPSPIQGAPTGGAPEREHGSSIKKNEFPSLEDILYQDLMNKTEMWKVYNNDENWQFNNKSSVEPNSAQLAKKEFDKFTHFCYNTFYYINIPTVNKSRHDPDTHRIKHSVL